EHVLLMKGPILLVDDDDALRETLQEILEQEGYRVVSASNGREALRVLERDRLKPAAIVLDVMMPEMNGAELLDRLKHDRNLAKIPALVLSASSKSAPLADRFVEKPIHVGTFLDIVDEMTSHREAA